MNRGLKMKKYIPHLILTITLLISITFNIIQCVNTNRSNSNTIFNDNIHSIVEIKATTENVGESFGTAEFIDSDGTLITNAHVVTYNHLKSVCNIIFKNMVQKLEQERLMSI